MTGVVIVVSFRGWGGGIRGLIPLRVFETKVTTARVILLPSGYQAKKINMLTGTTFQKESTS